jgi:hypothetical protein
MMMPPSGAVIALCVSGVPAIWTLLVVGLTAVWAFAKVVIANIKTKQTADRLRAEGNVEFKCRAFPSLKL